MPYPALFDLASLTPSQGFVISSFVGSVAAAGDVNGDGVNDLLVGSPGSSPVGPNNGLVRQSAGVTYLLFGDGDWTGVDLFNLPLAQGVRVIGATGAVGSFSSGDQLGASLAAGDVNGDGFTDILVAAGNRMAGTTYVLFGHAPPFQTVDLAFFPFGIPGVRLDSVGGASGGSGHSLATADVNGDGLADMVVGVPGSSVGGRADTGITYVVFGKASGLQTGSLSTATADGSGFRILGPSTDVSTAPRSGASVANAGDVNGDGFEDLIIGAAGADALGRINAGVAYVIFGKASGFGTIDLTSLQPSQGFQIVGAVSPIGHIDLLGSSVSSAGDVNGDGLDDVIVGAPYRSSDTIYHYGAVFVIFGKATGLEGAVFDAAGAIAPTDGFRIDGVGIEAGAVVSSAGDFNGDGFGDFIFTSPGDSPALPGGGFRNGAGSAYVIYGRASGLESIDLAHLSASDGFRIIGAFQGNALYNAASLGDLNDDGFSDIVVTAGGASYVLYGAATGALDRVGTSAADRLFGGDFNDSLRSLDGNDSLAGRGGDDLLIGGAGADTLSGGLGADIFRGTRADVSGDTITDLDLADRIDLTDVSPSSTLLSRLGGTVTLAGGGSFALSDAVVGRLFASSNGAGGTEIRLAPQDQHFNDFNHDSRPDILWNRVGSADTALWTMNANAVTGGFGVANPGPAWTLVEQADFSGDGRTDLLWRNTQFGYLAVWTMNGGNVTAGIGIATKAAPWSLAGAGDFNGDNRADIVWRNTATGEVDVWLNGGGNLAFSSAITAGNDTSWHIVGAADFTGDGKADLLFRSDAGGHAMKLWSMDGGVRTGEFNLPNPGAAWQVIATGDFNADGKADIVFQNGIDVAVWETDGSSVIAGIGIPRPSAGWAVVDVNDHNGDGYSDILWRNASGDVALWTMREGTVLGGFGVPNPSNAWAPLVHHFDIV